MQLWQTVMNFRLVVYDVKYNGCRHIYFGGVACTGMKMRFIIALVDGIRIFLPIKSYTFRLEDRLAAADTRQ